MSGSTDLEEARARNRYVSMNAARLGGAAVTMAGLAGVRDVLPVPYLLSVAMVLAGIAAFFFGPPFLVKRWKASDRAEDTEQ